MERQYDAVVIGSGTAGQTAAYALRTHGMTVAVADHSPRPGGVCALAGCQAKKWFYEAAEVVARSRHLKGKGVRTSAEADWALVLKEKNKFTSRIPAGTLQGFEDSGIDFINGRAQFVDEHSIVAGNDRIISDYIVVATGAVPMPLSFAGAEYLIHSDAFLELSELPRRIAFVGGGFISFEFAHFASRLGGGDTRCTILEAGPRPLKPFDPEMVDLLVNFSRNEGLDIHCDVEITSIVKTAGGFQIKTASGETFEADLVVHGAGRVADIEQLDLDKAGIAFDKRGIRVTAGMTTTNPRIFAVGDCAATVQLARVADYEAQVAADNIAACKANKTERRDVDYSAVPSVLFTYPQYAMVGMTEERLAQDDVAYDRSFGKELTWPTYRRTGLKGAAYKVLAAADGKILGAHFLSDDAAGLINTFRLAMTNGITAAALYRQSIMTPYPSRESDIIYMLRPLMKPH